MGFEAGLIYIGTSLEIFEIDINKPSCFNVFINTGDDRDKGQNISVLFTPKGSPCCRRSECLPRDGIFN